MIRAYKQTPAKIQQALDNALNPDAELKQPGVPADAEAVGIALHDMAESTEQGFQRQQNLIDDKQPKGDYVSRSDADSALTEVLRQAKETIPNSATVNEDNELIMQRAEGDAVSELFKVALPQGGSADIPDTLPNPHPLTFTGAVQATYDGSAPVTVEIPMGGSGVGETGGGFGLGVADNYDIELITEVYDIDQANIPTRIDITQKDDGTSFAYDGIIIWTDAKDSVSYTTVIFNKNNLIKSCLTHGDKTCMNLFITDGTTMFCYKDKMLPMFVLKQSRAEVGNMFYPDGLIQQVPEKFTTVSFGAFLALGSITFYKIWGLKKK